MAFLLQRTALPIEKHGLVLSAWQAAAQAAVSRRAALTPPPPETGR